MATTFGASAPASLPDTRWRTRDIVMAAVIGVAFAVVFWAWTIVWLGPLAPLGALALPLRDLGYAVWLIPAKEAGRTSSDDAVPPDRRRRIARFDSEVRKTR